MQILFIHQNFPAQFVHLATELAKNPANKVFGLGENPNRPPKDVVHARYKKPDPAGDRTHRYLRLTEAAIRRAQTATQACWSLKQRGVNPDIVYCHPGWGEGLYLRDVFPDARIVQYCEFYYRSHGGDVGFEPGKEVSLDEMARVRTMNLPQILALEAADWCTSPTLWQRSRYPEWVRRMTSVIHEGVDPDFSTPDGPAQVQLPDGRTLGPEEEVVTMVARNLEPYRGLRTFLHALPEIFARRPRAQALLVGADERGYGPMPADGKNWRETILAELGETLDLSRVHFAGRLPHAVLQCVFRLSKAHVYLTFPFVLSWSMVEAMSCGALVIGSSTPPVEEVLQHGENGLLVPFFDTAALAETVVQALSKPDDYAPLRAAARRTALEQFHLRDVILPRQVALMEALAQGVPPASIIPPPIG